MYQGPSSFLSLSKILTGLSKTLNIANKIIPLYEKAKPITNNFKKIVKVLNQKQTTSKQTKNVPKNKNTFQFNNPTFFK